MEITSPVQNHRGCMLFPQLSLNGMIRYVDNMKIIICSSMSPLFLSNSEAAAAAAVVSSSSFCCLWLDKRLRFLSLEMAMAIQATANFHRNLHFELLKRVNLMQAA